MNRDEPQMPHLRAAIRPPGAELSAERRAYLRQVRRQKQEITLWRAGVLVGLLLLWEIAARLGWIDSFIMSSPSRILDTLFSLADNQILMHFSVTLYETLTGFVIGAFGGLLLAILLWQSELVSKILEPYLVVLNSLPKIALGPVIIIWVGAGTEAIIVMAVAISMIVTVLEMLEGFRSTDPELIRMAETFGASRQQIFRKIVFPANIPVLFNSLKINIGAFAGGSHRRGIPGVQGGTGVPHCLWRAGVPAGSGDDRRDHSGADGSGYVPLHHPGGEPGSAGAQTLTEFCIV